jgi:hypothetical protein
MKRRTGIAAKYKGVLYADASPNLLPKRCGYRLDRAIAAEMLDARACTHKTGAGGMSALRAKRKGSIGKTPLNLAENGPIADIRRLPAQPPAFYFWGGGGDPKSRNLIEKCSLRLVARNTAYMLRLLTPCKPLHRCFPHQEAAIWIPVKSFVSPFSQV